MRLNRITEPRTVMHERQSFRPMSRCWQLVPLAVMVLGLAMAQTARADDQSKLLGEIDFPTSASGDAQDAFIEGVLYMHNFEYADAAAAFQQAQKIAPDFAMAYWGEAMTYNHPLWHQQAREEALDVLRRLGRTPEARAAKCPTQREKEYLHAVETLYGTIDATHGMPKDQRDDAYSEAMRRLHERYPEDDEATTLYGLSILGTAHEGRDFATYMRAAAVLTTVWDKNRRHPGAAHYLIHSYDDPIHAPLGLPMARAYSDIAPAAAHAQHMTSHIFVALGMWDDLVEANERACDVTNDGLAEEGKPPAVSTHYTYWLLYGYLQQGRLDEAKELMDRVYSRILEHPTSSERAYFVMHRARYIIDTQDWMAADRYVFREHSASADHPNYTFTTALAAAKRGDRERAAELLEQVRPSGARGEVSGEESIVAILKRELGALLLADAKKFDEAAALLREAVASEDAMPYTFGPPNIVKPSSELLGEVLYEAGQHGAAMDAFEAQLQRTPLRTASLLGLARAAEAAGDTDTAADAYRRLAEAWDKADPRLPGYEEVKAATAASSD